MPLIRALCRQRQVDLRVQCQPILWSKVQDYQGCTKKPFLEKRRTAKQTNKIINVLYSSNSGKASVVKHSTSIIDMCFQFFLLRQMIISNIMIIIHFSRATIIHQWMFYHKWNIESNPRDSLHWAIIYTQCI